MRGAFARQEMLALKDAAHSLKSSSAMLGLARLAAISKEIEQVIVTKHFDRVENLNHAAHNAFHDARPFIDEVLQAA
jgi:HPt (histidine-containing phosphotransfer) domain-containing protein